MFTTDSEGRVRYRALALLEGDCAPLLRHRRPYWRPAAPRILEQVHAPTWTWHSAQKWVPGADYVALDVAAAYLAAASSTTVAHGALARTPRVDRRTAAWAPGAYLIDVHPWQVRSIVSPLGSVELPAQVWVMAPTVTLLEELSRDGYWPEVTVHDAYTSGDMVRLRTWTNRVRDDRAAVIDRMIENPVDDGAQERYEAIKTGYSQAIQMLVIPPDPKGTPADKQRKRNQAYRPDWTLTIWAQHAANTWRKAWKAARFGLLPMAMGSVDEITYDPETLQDIQMLARPPFRMDPTGRQPGALRVKEAGVVPGVDA